MNTPEILRALASAEDLQADYLYLNIKNHLSSEMIPLANSMKAKAARLRDLANDIERQRAATLFSEDDSLNQLNP